VDEARTLLVGDGSRMAEGTEPATATPTSTEDEIVRLTVVGGFELTVTPHRRPRASLDRAMTTDQILTGVGLTVVLAVGCQILANRLRIPAIVVLLPVGFAAGAITDDIVPTNIVGSAFEPLVSLAIAVILFDSGVELDLQRLLGSTRRVVTRLTALGVPTTWAIAGLSAALVLGMSTEVAVMIGAILVVSGLTLVGPLLAFVRPSQSVRRVLSWESSVIDPIGGVLGALTFHAIVAGGYELGQFLASVAVGGVVGTGVLWLLLRYSSLSEVLGTSGTLATVIGVAAAATSPATTPGSWPRS
jgi:NhaP-type Na+/H+ or K+/H+ antiporter